MHRIHMNETALRLLVVLEVLVAERSVTRAAERLGLTQPAVSHALRQLRQMFGDDLLVRDRSGMVPTPLALDLLPGLRSGLSELERVLNRDTTFDPASSRRIFTMATVDYPQIVGLPALIARLRNESPGIDVRVRGIQPGIAEMLATGWLDVVLAGGETERELALDKGLMRTTVFDEPLVCILRHGHPALDGPLTLDAYAALDHILVSTAGGDRGMVDGVLDRERRTRRVAVTVSQFVGAPPLVAASDLVATVPRGLAEYFSAFLPITMREPPIALPRGRGHLWWHQRYQNDPGHRWWRTALCDAYAPFRTG